MRQGKRAHGVQGKVKEGEKQKADVVVTPKLEAYDREVFYSISIRDLLIDVVFIIFSFFVSEELFSDSGIFYHAEHWQILALYCAVTLTLPYYLGYLYVKYSWYYPKPAMKIYLWTFCLMTLMVLVYMMRLVFDMGDIENAGNDVTGFFAVFAIFLLVLGPMMSLGGAMTAEYELKNQDENEAAFEPEKYGGLMAFFILILSIAFMIIFIGLLPEKYSGLGAVLGMFVGPISAFIVLGLLLGFFWLLTKFGIYRHVVMVARNTFPFFIVSVLVYWSGVSLHFMQSDFGDHSGKISWAGILFSVCVSGLLPFRIITMFNPPWRINNIIIGIIALAWFLWCMNKLTH